MRYAILLLAAIAQAQTSVVFSRSTTATLAYGGFTAAQSVMVEGRIHARTISSDYTFAWQLGNVQNALQITWVGTSLNDRIGCLFANAPVISVSPSPVDFDFRWQRTTTRKICEVWAIAQDGSPIFYRSDVATTPVAIPAGNITIGSPNNEFALAFLRISVDAPLPAGSPPPSLTQAKGNWANWNFEGSQTGELITDSSGNNRHLTFNTAAQTIATPPPVLQPPFEVIIQFRDLDGNPIDPPVTCSASPCDVRFRVEWKPPPATP